MPAYVIVEIDILDPAGYKEYKNLASATVEKYGGKYIVRGGRTEVLRRLEPEAYCPARVRVGAACQGMAQLPGVSRAAQNAPSYRENKHDRG